MGAMEIFSGVKSFSKKRDLAVQAGFNKQELQGFMKMAGSLASATSRVDASAEGFGPQFKSRVVDKKALDASNRLNASTDVGFQDRTFNQGENLYTQEFSKDQVQGFIKAFSARQDEVFGRRAQPGVVNQTRLV